MNTSGCPAGLATDEILTYADPISRCNMSVAAYLGVMIGYVVFKAFIALAQLNLWIWREKNQKKRNPTSNPRQRRGRQFYLNTKFPLAALLTSLMAVNFAIFTAFTAANLANRTNGFALFLFGFALTPGFLSHLLYMYKFVGLGHRIIKQGKWIPQSDAAKMEKLSYFSWTGRILNIGYNASVVGALVSSLILGPVFAGRLPPFQTMFALSGLFELLITVGIVSHIQRIIDVVYKALQVELGIPSEGKKDLQSAIRRLREQQFAVAFLVWIGALPLFLIAALDIPARFYFYMLGAYVECLTQSTIFISASRQWRREKMGRAKTASDNARDFSSDKRVNAAEAITPNKQASGEKNTTVSHSRPISSRFDLAPSSTTKVELAPSPMTNVESAPSSTPT